MMPIGETLQLASSITLGLVFLGIAAASVRLVLGPSLADRVVALDFISIGLVALTALRALQSGHTAYLDVGAAVALTAFLATVAFARFAERRGAPKQRGEASDD
jgi:multisubunit Na+/H+ antiporter MnhF subunit